MPLLHLPRKAEAPGARARIRAPRSSSLNDLLSARLGQSRPLQLFKLQRP